MSADLQLAVTLVFELGPLLVFWGLDLTLGLKIAIAGTMIFVIADAVRRHLMRAGFDRIWLLAAGMTLVFGAVDLYARTPFMLKYEAVITNIATAAVFALGMRGARPLLQEIAERAEPEAFAPRPDIRRFFQLLTLVWVAYFLLKAALYLWLARMLTLERAMAARTIIGTASMVGMMGLSMQGRRLFALCKAWGWLPAGEMVLADDNNPA
ncbi:MAG: septation protein IspZ [Rhodospirillales bacterium]|nr:septation protein IspZ [Rhodospirillales bacterium]MDE2574188.1 septation protein IspZ [Rhodospirillales bacterium]